MTLPAAIRAGVEGVLGESITGAERVGGGCISPAARLRKASGGDCFIKWTEGGPAGLFEAESRGLAALRAAGAVRVPEVIAAEADWLLLEWLEPRPADEWTWSRMGQDLAALHACTAPSFGAAADNFIGPLPQSNRPSPTWAGFWRERRLGPQLARASSAFRPADRSRLERFLEDGLDALLGPGEQEGPSLLHGDLWGGNVLVTRGGRAALVDPSAYHGHREVDLAMADLFGGFDGAFFDTYAAEWPLREGWRERRAAYQLYYLLVHVNLFGSGYVAGTLRALGAAGG